MIYSQFGLAIHQNDHQARRRFVEWAQNEIAVVPDFHKRILFSDEAHFWLNGYVNKQNCRIWSEANPQVYVETPLHPEKLTVWCALLAGGIIGPYSFKNDEGHNVTVNGDRYRAMITNFFIPELNNHDVQELWFQHDGATCYTARATIDLLKDTFGDRLISRFGPSCSFRFCRFLGTKHIINNRKKYRRLLGSSEPRTPSPLCAPLLTTEQLLTVLTEIEGVINSRPITYVGSETEEPIPLTPAHFIIEKRITSLPPHIKDDQLPRNFWKLGKILELFPGRDGKITALRPPWGASRRKRYVADPRKNLEPGFSAFGRCRLSRIFSI
ncbi:transposable element Tc3 transposase [Trichonephila clavipes]|nr:transposable element Tc3 transposase [Trichonephila clavipes]